MNKIEVFVCNFCFYSLSPNSYGSIQVIYIKKSTHKTFISVLQVIPEMVGPIVAGLLLVDINIYCSLLHILYIYTLVIIFDSEAIKTTCVTSLVKESGANRMINAVVISYKTLHI